MYIRTIARLDIKNSYVIKGIHLEGLRKVGCPNKLALKYYNEGIDEILFMDAVASLYNRNGLFDIINKATEDIFVPITVGGGIRSLEDIFEALKVGADKVAINTGAIKNINLIKEASLKFGSQCIVGSIEAKKKNNKWEAYIDNGREPTGLDVVQWAIKLKEAGAGEIMLTSIDQEGTKKGFDINLIKEVQSAIKAPIIISGGYGSLNHIKNLQSKASPSGIAIASILHYELDSIHNIKSKLNNE